ncbi:hypothetical protein NLU13_6661 [Sarocladium strictum]|uniref:Major facilitator superfamily (MFS) profile domain-containing protein n=1 Tax=Sarocladium strictum TaxID=5046 RepID=A0AA39GEC6_SARSR|nr:hypothetical protein NLU13_6661 [Sarocladium strictum]
MADQHTTTSASKALAEKFPCSPNDKGKGDNVRHNIPGVQETHRNIHGWRWAVAYSAMLSTTFLFALDNTIVGNIQPSIVKEFKTIELMPWIGTGFALGTMFILLWGKVYGVFNIKWVYIFNIFLFEIGSAICGAAPTIEALIIGRIIAGVGGSGMYSGTLTYVSVLCDQQEKPAYLAGSTVVWGVGSVLGPVVGGAFAGSSATWRWGFYINLPFGALFAPAYILLFPNVDPKPSDSFADKLRLVDWINAIIFLAGSTCLTIAVTFGGVVYVYNSPVIITLWILTAVLLVAFAVSLRFHPLVSKEDSLYPAHFFKSFTLVNLQLQVLLSSGIILAMTYYVPLYFQFVKSDGPLEAGIRLFPLIMLLVTASMFNGFLMPKFGRIPLWYTGGSGLALVGSALMFTITEKSSNSEIYGYNILVGAGAGCYIVAGFAIAQALVKDSDIPNVIAQDLGMVLFLAISGSLFHNVAMHKISNALPTLPNSIIVDLIAGTSSEAFRTLSDGDKELIIPLIASAMKRVWAFFMVASGLSFVCSFQLARRRSARLGSQRHPPTLTCRCPCWDSSLRWLRLCRYSRGGRLNLKGY